MRIVNEKKLVKVASLYEDQQEGGARWKGQYCLFLCFVAFVYRRDFLLNSLINIEIYQGISIFIQRIWETKHVSVEFPQLLVV